MVGDDAVDEGVVHAGDGEGLRRVPVGGGESDRGGGNRAFGGVVGTDVNADVGGGLAVQDDVEGRRCAIFGGVAGDGGNRDACIVGDVHLVKFHFLRAVRVQEGAPSELAAVCV